MRIKHFLPLTLLAFGALPAVLQAQNLTFDELKVVGRAVRSSTRSAEQALADAQKSGSDYDSAQKSAAKANLLQRAFTLGLWPSSPNVADKSALREWLYIEVSGLTAMNALIHSSADTATRPEKDAEAVVLKKLADQYAAAVAGLDDSTMSSWGYSDKTYTDAFHSDPVPVDSWFAKGGLPSLTTKYESPAGPIQVTLNVADGSVIKDQTTLVIGVKSTSLPSKVEVYEGDDLKATPEAQPFTFQIDPLDLPDGDLKLKLIAYTEDGNKTQVNLKFTIDSGDSMGAEAAVAKGRDLLSQRDFEGAQRYARIALKASPDDLSGKSLMAISSYFRGQVDIAEKFALDVDAKKPDDVSNLKLLSGINVYKAFETRSAGDADAAKKTVHDALVASARYQRRVLDIESDQAVSKAKGSPDETALADMIAFRYSAATEIAHKNALATQMKDETAVDAYAFGLMQQARYTEALDALVKHDKFGSSAYSLVLRSVLESQLGDDALSRATEARISSDPSSLVIAAGKAANALKRKDIKAFASAVDQLKTIDSSSSVTGYYSLVWAWATHDYDKEVAAFRKALEDNPGSYPILLAQGVRQANQAFVAVSKKGSDDTSAEEGKAMFLAALEAKPDSGEALAGLALIDQLTGDSTGALQNAKAATAASPKYAVGWFVLAAIYREAVQGGSSSASNSLLNESQKAMDHLKALDPLMASQVPALLPAWQAYLDSGSIPVLPAPTGPTK